jgi:hypothetical protein
VTPEDWFKLVGLVVGFVGGPYTVWVLIQKRVTDLEVAKSKRELAEEAWWEAIEELRKTSAALDKACAVATGNLATSVAGLTNRVDLHTTTNLSAIIGLVKNYNEMLEESVAALRSAVELLRTAVMSIKA